MDRKSYIPEINNIRGLSALAVVVMHSINTHNRSQWLPEIEKLMLFATPTFLFIAAFLMFYSDQSNKSPLGFLWARLKYILIPYIVWSAVYTITYRSTFPTLEIILTNILSGRFHLYFILIIVQFYVLFIALKTLKLKDRLLSLPILLSLFIFNYIYLTIFTGVGSPHPTLDELWRRNHYLIFPAWIFYFFLGGYIAKNYLLIKDWLASRRYHLFTMALTLMVYVVYTVVRPVTSKRPEILIYSTVIILFFLSLSFLSNKELPILSTISRFSFGIYLSHRLFYALSYKHYLGSGPWDFFLLSFAVQLGGGLLLTFLLSSLPGGQFLVGKIPKAKKTSSINHREISQTAQG